MLPSAFSVQWLEVICEIATFYRFCEITEEHLDTNG